MTILEQMRLTQIQMDSNLSPYEKIEAVRDAIIKEHEEREANMPNLTACLLVFSSETHAVKQVTKQLRYEHKNPETSMVSGFCGGDCWTRTSDLMRVKHAL